LFAAVELSKSEIAAVDFETLGRVIIRLYSGQRLVLTFFRFPNYALDAVGSALRDALQQNQKTRGLWDGAKIFSWYSV
jgi:hypothetical protein